jgi:hypothetical protein
MDQFELDIYSYLNALAAGELQGSNPTSDRWLSGKSLGFISLILAVLAAGAHFSDIENPERASLCQDLGVSSVHYSTPNRRVTYCVQNRDRSRRSGWPTSYFALPRISFRRSYCLGARFRITASLMLHGLC